MQLALFEPDIPQNTGSLMRLSACMGAPLHIIEPCGFAFDDRRLKRSVMDYAPLSEVVRHSSWNAFLTAIRPIHRLVLLTTKATTPYTDIAYTPSDILLLGRESSGVPQYVRDVVDLSVIIPMREGARSINVAISAGMVLGEAIRQTRGNV